MMRSMPHEDWFERMHQVLYEGRSPDDFQVLPPRRPVPPEVRRERWIARQTAIGCPPSLPPASRQPPRRTFRGAPWRLAGYPQHRPDLIPSLRDLAMLFRCNSPYQARYASFIALATSSGIPTATAILSLPVQAVPDLLLPATAWAPLLRLLEHRQQRGVLGNLMFSTFRFGLGKPVARRDFNRQLAWYQIRRGYIPPFTCTALLRCQALADEPRLSFEEKTRQPCR
jgi:hypothetical protein